jgi:perosamine synthetase
MTDLQAALGLCQLEALDGILAKRAELAERYTAALASIPGIRPPQDPPYAQRTWQSYCVRIEPHAAVGRTELMRRLLADGVATRRGVMAIHEEDAYAGEPVRPMKHTEAAASETLMLPLFPDLTYVQQDYVIDRLASHVATQAA